MAESFILEALQLTKIRAKQRLQYIHAFLLIIIRFLECKITGFSDIAAQKKQLDEGHMKKYIKSKPFLKNIHTFATQHVMHE